MGLLRCLAGWLGLPGSSADEEPTCPCRRHKRRVQSLGWQDPLEKEMTTCSSILAWEILWTEEPDRLQSLGSQDFPVPYKAWCLIRYVCELQGMVRKTKEGKGLPVEGKGSQWSADLSPNPMIPNNLLIRHLDLPFPKLIPGRRWPGWKFSGHSKEVPPLAFPVPPPSPPTVLLTTNIPAYIVGSEHRRWFEWLFSQFSHRCHITDAILNA